MRLLAQLAPARVLVPLLTLAAAGGVAGCGTSKSTPARPPVRLTLSAPADGVRTSASTVRVAGRVSPSGARVLVLGHPVSVVDGAFSDSVALRPGVTIIDVIAGAARARAAVAAVRVTRYVLVSVPYVVGDSPTQARRAVTAAGLSPAVLNDHNPLRFLLPFPYRVCQTDPPAKARVSPGSTVTLEVDKICS